MLQYVNPNMLQHVHPDQRQAESLAPISKWAEAAQRQKATQQAELINNRIRSWVLARKAAQEAAQQEEVMWDAKQERIQSWLDGLPSHGWSE
jgi:hypothetical protein